MRASATTTAVCTVTFWFDRLVARTFLRIVSKDGRMPETYSITLRGVSVLRAWYAERDMADSDWMQEPQRDA